MNTGMMYEADLKPCECGSHPVIIHHYAHGVPNRMHYFVQCPSCKARTRERKAPAGAVEDWNAGIRIYRTRKEEKPATTEKD